LVGTKINAFTDASFWFSWKEKHTFIYSTYLQYISEIICLDSISMILKTTVESQSAILHLVRGMLGVHPRGSLNYMCSIQLLRLSPTLRLSPNTSVKGLLGIANKLINFLAIPSNLSRSYLTFPLCSGTTLIEIDKIHNIHEGRIYTQYTNLFLLKNFLNNWNSIPRWKRV
jgi:hypothetical protein